MKPEDAAAVERLLATRAAAGLPAHVEDRAVLREIAAIIRSADARGSHRAAPLGDLATVTPSRPPRPPRIPLTLRRAVLARGAYRCAYCDGDATEVDHMMPASRGGPNDPANLAPACRECNYEKSDFTIAEWADWRIHHGLSWPVNRIKDVADVVAATLDLANFADAPAVDRQSRGGA